jgi:ABC-2 type transport system ATP-binding protein
MDSTAPLVQLQSLTKKYGDFVALDHCDLEIARGQVFGLLGPNGAGKTTLLRILMGFLHPSSGSARIAGLDCCRQRVQVHQHVSYIPGEPRLFRTMRGKSVLKFFSQVRPDGNFERALRIARRLDLNLDRWVGFMSTGMRQKLALAACLSIDAPLLIMDEPTANLDPTVRGEVIQLVAEAKAAGRTVVFCSHVLSEIEEVCDDVAILRAGRLVHHQSIHDLNRQHRLHCEFDRPPDGLPTDLPGVTFEPSGNVLTIETQGRLDELLPWLARSGARNVQVERVGLRAVYDRYHGPMEREVV